MRCRPPSHLIGVAALALVIAIAACAPASARSLRIVRPLAGQTVTGDVAVVARASSRARVVRFYLDGARRWTDRRAPFRLGGRRGFLETGALTPGRHRLTVRARFHHSVQTASEVIWVRAVAGSRRRLSRSATFVHPRRAPHAAAAAVSRPAAPTPRQYAAPVTVTAGAATTDSLLFSSDFSSPTFPEWTDVQRVADDRIQVVPAPNRSGTAARFEVRNGDHVNGEQNSRAELAWGGHLFSEGEETTFTWSTMLAPGFPAPSDSQWADLLQWKNEGSGSPPLQVGVDNGNIDLTAGSQANWKTLWSTPVVRGQWVDFAARIKWSTDPSVGWVDFWFNGVKVVDHAPLATLYPGLRNYLKIGYYRASEIADPGVVYDADLRVTGD